MGWVSASLLWRADLASMGEPRVQASLHAKKAHIVTHGRLASEALDEA